MGAKNSSNKRNRSSRSIKLTSKVQKEGLMGETITTIMAIHRIATRKSNNTTGIVVIRVITT